MPSCDLRSKYRHQYSRGADVFQMLSILAEFETNLRKERQMLGIAAAKARGVYRKKNGEAHNKKHSDAAILELVAAGKVFRRLQKLLAAQKAPLLGRIGRHDISSR